MAQHQVALDSLLLLGVWRPHRLPRVRALAFLGTAASIARSAEFYGFGALENLGHIRVEENHNRFRDAACYGVDSDLTMLRVIRSVSRQSIKLTTVAIRTTPTNAPASAK